MILDMNTLIHDLQEVNLTAASPAKVKALGGLAYLLYPYAKEIQQLTYDITEDRKSVV